MTRSTRSASWPRTFPFPPIRLFSAPTFLPKGRPTGRPTGRKSLRVADTLLIFFHPSLIPIPQRGRPGQRRRGAGRSRAGATITRSATRAVPTAAPAPTTRAAPAAAAAAAIPAAASGPRRLRAPQGGCPRRRRGAGLHLQGVKVPEAVLRVLRGGARVRARVRVSDLPEQRALPGREEVRGQCYT